MSDVSHIAVVGLTGGIGSGKSLASGFFAELGVPVIDTDQIAHALTKPDGRAIAALEAAFGAAVFKEKGVLDRNAMRSLVFSSNEAKAKLEAILHPLIKEEALSQMKTVKNAPYLILVIPLLSVSTKDAWHLSRILLIDCQEVTQIKRVILRNGFREEEVRAVMAHQASRSERLAIADDVLENEADGLALKEKVAKQHERYLAAFAQKR